jgi:hypothetical protein
MYKFLDDQNYDVLKQPLTKAQMKELQDDAGYVEGVIEISLADMIDNDLENFLDYIAYKLIDSPCLMDIQYSIVGCADEYTVLLKVSGQIDWSIEDDTDCEQEE